MDYDALLRDYLRQFRIRVAIAFPTGPRLVMLQPRATVNDLYRQADVPRLHTFLYTENGIPVPRVDEFVAHFFSRLRVSLWQLKPRVYRLMALTSPLMPIRILTGPAPPPEDTIPPHADEAQTETQESGACALEADAPASAQPLGP